MLVPGPHAEPTASEFLFGDQECMPLTLLTSSLMCHQLGAQKLLPVGPWREEPTATAPQRGRVQPCRACGPAMLVLFESQGITGCKMGRGGPGVQSPSSNNIHCLINMFPRGSQHWAALLGVRTTVGISTASMFSPVLLEGSWIEPEGDTKGTGRDFPGKAALPLLPPSDKS